MPTAAAVLLTGLALALLLWLPLLLLLLIQLEVVLRALSMLSGVREPLLNSEEGMEANAVCPLSLLALLLQRLLLLSTGLLGEPWWLLLLWLLTMRVRPGSPAVLELLAASSAPPLGP